MKEITSRISSSISETHDLHVDQIVLVKPWTIPRTTSADAQLPTKAALMERYDVALNTVERATEVLRGLGLVETYQGVGTFARKPPADSATDSERLAALERRVARLEAQMMDVCAGLGMPVYAPEHAEESVAEATG
jgi:DNA-binding transcriptional regulator YhcF (GntR family)